MIIEQIYTGCLAQGAYYIESNNEAVIIDPLREVQPYIDRANQSGAKIKYVLETHFHADFVSGHLDLSKKTGAKIVFGPNAKSGFDAHIAQDNEVLQVGDCTITVLHTPGHTMESSCYLLKDANGKNVAIFTGDTLFIGDVGRPDLAQNADVGLTQERLAEYLYDSLRTKIMPLEDDLIVYPAHGAGSACGKNMSKETFDTLGNQKKTNYALQDITKEQFVKEVTEGILPPPAYFPENVAMNKMGYQSFDNVLNQGLKPLSVEEFEAIQKKSGALILDTRAAADFHKGFIPNAINIGIDGGFAPWVGTVITDIKQPILIVTEEHRQEEVITRLSRVGYDNVLGYLKGGFDSWKTANKPFDAINRISATEFNERIKTDKESQIFDIRKETEFDNGSVCGAENKPLAYINQWKENIDKTKHFYIFCAGGYRSMIGSSILKQIGIDNFTEIEGGYNAISNTNSCCATK
ncbi:MAG: MBL fold metallo-hydrolase [Bacteroidota bacterium]|nr:MBL fold metallo-hydrolase [Bacteroidota bacterium]